MVWLLLLLPPLAALAAWRLAPGLGRSARVWAIWTLALGGLPLLWLMIEEVAGLPRPARPAAGRHRCCEAMELGPVADLGHAAGVDFDLERCAACGAYVVQVGYAGSVTPNVVADATAAHFLALRDTPELKRALKAWFD